MTQKISRRKLASYVVDRFESGAPLATLLKEVAAYLVDSKRTREADLLVRTIEDVFAERGLVVARVTTAHPLTDVLRREISKLVGGDKVHLDEIVDSTVIGGVRIDTPGKSLDATIERKLLALRQAKM